MKTKLTITTTIRKELISMFASLDAWFDKLLDDGFDPESDRLQLEWVEHVFFSNHQLLQLIRKDAERTLDLLSSEYSLQDGSLEELRSALREQLFQSLCMVDYLDESILYEPLDLDKPMLLHEKLVLIAEHIRYHLEVLDALDYAEGKRVQIF